MRFGSVCSGIEAASVAWHPLGWSAAWLAEIEKFPAAVLAHHYPNVPNLGDMTKLPERIASGQIEAPDVLCGGTPCQAFSFAGLRKSLDDARGNLSLTFCEIANAIDTARSIRGEHPTIVFWENVPGVLSTKDNAFGCFLAGLAGEDDPLVPPGGKWSNAGAVFGPTRAVAWRVLDAQYFGVAQRRRRVFVVASARSDFDPAAVLFEFDGVRRDSAPSREEGQGSAGGAAAGTFECGGIGSYNRSSVSSPILRTGADNGHGCEAIITMAHGQGGAEIGFDRSPPLTCNHEAPIAAHSLRGEGFDASVDRLRAFEKSPMAVQPAAGIQVRRLTPVECEKLQGFEPGYTAIPWRKKPASECPDGPRYKALGNSWAVPVVRWIGARIHANINNLSGNTHA